MRFTINLATKVNVDQRLVSQVSFAVIALLLLALSWNTFIAFSNLGELHRTEADTATCRGRLNRPA